MSSSGLVGMMMMLFLLSLVYALVSGLSIADRGFLARTLRERVRAVVSHRYAREALRDILIVETRDDASAFVLHDPWHVTNKSS
jgi:hypothetical protein